MGSKNKAKTPTNTDGQSFPEKIDGDMAPESDWESENVEEEEDGKQYWLMKAEPDSRIEKGVDVKFSIDDLMNATEPEGWDGKYVCKVLRVVILISLLIQEFGTLLQETTYEL